MLTIFRNIFAVILGFIAGGCVNTGLVRAGLHVIAAPPGVNMEDAESLAASIHLLEPKHFIFPLFAHAIGTFAGALVAFLIAGSRWTIFAYVIGIFFLAGGIAACFMIPAPIWLMALDVVVAYLPMAWLAARVGAKLKRRWPN